MNILKRTFLALLISAGVCALPGLAFASVQPDPPDHATLSAQQDADSSAESDALLSALATTSATKGIDVSSHQGKIDWAAVKASGVQYAIIRIGYGGNWEDQDDSCFAYNVSECERLGIPYGIYLYSYAWDVSSAKDEAAHVIRLLKGHHPQYPVYWDLEYQSDGRPAGLGDAVAYLSNDDLAENAQAFCEAIQNAGYTPGIYASLNWWNNYLTSSVFNRWERWVAQWNSSCSYTGTYYLWQYSSSGSVDGISGNVDMDYDYCPGRVNAGVCLGDANANGKITVVDAQIAYDTVKGKYGTSWAKLIALRSNWNKTTVLYVLDANRDGKLDATDAFAIQYLALHQQ